jgi:hypothetical protein
MLGSRFPPGASTRVLAGALLLALGACGSRPESPAGAAGGPASGASDPGPIRQIPTPAGADSSGPRLAAGPDGTTVLSWIEPIGDAFDNQLKFARWTGSAWSPARLVASGGDWYVNASDVPGVQPIAAGLWAAHWRVTSADERAYDVMTSVSSDAGATWSEPRLLNDDGTATEHGFVSLFDWDGDVGAVWLDGRELAGGEGADANGAPLGTTLRAARLTAEGAVAEQRVLDALVCDCCTTSVAPLASGAVLVYRDRTQDEIRDIVVRRRVEGQWSEPAQAGQDHWRIEGCPINGPAVAGLGTSVAVAWFTAADERARVRLAFSTDGAATFAPALEVDGDRPIGHVGVALADERTAFVTWWARGSGNGAVLAVRRVSASGELGPFTKVATSPSIHPDDVPQLTVAGGALLWAWTDSSDPNGVRTAIADVGGL